jgi:hypothetical protein
LGLVETHRQAVFEFDPAGQHVELQGTDDADDPARADLRLEQLRRALLGGSAHRRCEAGRGWGCR